MKRLALIPILTVFTVLTICSYPFCALAQATSDPVSLIGPILAALQNKQWLVLAGLLLMGIIYIVRTYVLAKWAWAQTDRGGAVVALVLSVLGATAVALSSGTISFMTLLDGIAAAMAAAGGYTLLRKIIAPSDVKKPA